MEVPNLTGQEADYVVTGVVDPFISQGTLKGHDIVRALLRLEIDLHAVVEEQFASDRDLSRIEAA